MNSNIHKENLREVLKLSYPNLCMSKYEFLLIENNADLKRNFYPGFGRYGKRGFYNNTTILWLDYGMESGYIKVGLKNQNKNGPYENWSDLFSLKEEGDALKVYKHMKYKLFW